MKQSCLLIALTVLLPALAAGQEEPGTAAGDAGEPLPTEVVLEAEVFFQGPDGDSIVIGPGHYLVELVDEENLRLVSIEGEPAIVRATQTSHEQELDGMLALAEREGSDVMHVLLLMPGGKAYDAIASYSGVVTRGTPASPFARPKIQQAYMQSKRRPVPSAAAAGPASSGAPKSANGKAPWLVIDPAKRGYYVYKSYALPNVRDQLSSPVSDERYRKFVRGRAATFRMGNRNVPFKIDDNAIVDAGGNTLDQSNTVTLIDLDKSPAMRTAILQGLRISREDDYYINAFLVTSFAFDMDASKKARRRQLDLNESILVDVARKDHSLAAQWKFEDGKWTRLFEKRRSKNMQDPRPKLREIARRQAPRQFGNFKYVALEEQDASKPSKKKFGVRKGRGTPPMRCDISGCRDSRVASRGAPAAVESLGVLECDESGCNEIESAAISTREVTGEYMAYGMNINLDGCTNYCSFEDCQSCCIKHAAQQHLAITATAMACHALSDLCPWCHAGCAVAATLSYATLSTNDAICMTINCIPRKESLAKNPMNCPAIGSDAPVSTASNGIQVLNAFYGANCNVPSSKGDITAWTKRKCDGQLVCMFNLDWSIWGGHDPQPDMCKKKFDVRWICPDARTYSTSVYHTMTPQPIALQCK